MKILIVEDDTDIAYSLKEFFNLNNYEADMAFDGEEACYFAANYNYDVIIMDIMMPKMDGLTALTKIRKSGNNTPIIMLTAKSELDDKIDGLEKGADDYLTKPFQVKELLARVKALSRRKNTIVDNKSYGNVIFDASEYVIRVDKKSEHLTPKEYQLIEYLLMNQEKYCKSERIFEDVWSTDSESDITVVFVFVSTLRRKLKSIGANLKIESLRGEGYRLTKNNV